MIDFSLLRAHMYVVIRDEADNRMNICERIELCLQNECVAVFEGRWLDFHYYVKGAKFFVFTGRYLIKVAGGVVNYSAHLVGDDRLDRFDMSVYDLCKLLQLLAADSMNWHMSCVTKELAHWLTQPLPLDVFMLAFMCSTEAERRVY